MTKWIEDSSYFELLEIFETDKATKGVTMENRRFIEARKELIKRYNKHSEAYKFWIGRVHKECRQIFDKALQEYFKSVKKGHPKTFESCVESGIYSIYSTNVSQQKAPALNTRKFIQDLSNTEGSRSKFYVFPQQEVSSRKDRHDTALSYYLSKFARYESRLADNFAFHAHPKSSAKHSKIKVKAKTSHSIKIDNSRITLRLVPAKATEVFDKVAKEIVGSDDLKWEAVYSSKIMGPSKLPRSVDSMIIYVNSRDRVVIKSIVDFLTTNFLAKTYFVPGGPMGMFELAQGITYGESPNPRKGHSFGSTRGESIHMNMSKLFLDAVADPKKTVFDVVNGITEYDLHLGSYNHMQSQTLDYSMPAFRRPFSNMAVDPFGDHRRK